MGEFSERWQLSEPNNGPAVLRQLQRDIQASPGAGSENSVQHRQGAVDEKFDSQAAFQVSVAVAEALPQVIVSELGDDFSRRPAAVLTENVSGFVVGALGTLLLKKPQVAAALALPALSLQGYEALSTSKEIFAEGGKLSNKESREQFIQEKAQQLGAKTAHLLEASPALYFGGSVTSKAFGAPPLYTWLGEKTREKLIYPVKDRLAFVGFGVEKLGPGQVMVKDSGHLDAFALSEQLASRHFYDGREVGRTFDLASGKLSRVVVGKADDIGYLPGSLEADKVPFHVHGPDAPVGARPSLSDLAATSNLGLIKQGGKLAFYEGKADELKALRLAGAGDHFAPKLHTLILDTEAGTAVRVTGQFLRGRRLVNLEEQKVDYAEALRVLSNLDMKRVGQELGRLAAGVQ